MEEALFDKMNVKELRIQLELKGLDTKGLKADLLKRLKEYCSNSRKKRLSYQLNTELPVTINQPNVMLNVTYCTMMLAIVFHGIRAKKNIMIM
jgi:hypothetical protein